MDMTGEYRIGTTRQVVWDALNDPETLKQCIPGCEEINKLSDSELTAKVTAKVGPVKARFAGNVTLSDLNPPESYTISGEGKGGAAGFAKGGAKVHLAEDGDATVLTYEVHVSVGGKLAQLGARLISGTAKKMADDFFNRFSQAVHAQVVGPSEEAETATAEPVASEAAAEAPTDVPAAPPEQPAAPSEQLSAQAPARAGLSPVVWIGGVVVLVLVLILIFTA